MTLHIIIWPSVSQLIERNKLIKLNDRCPRILSQINNKLTYINKLNSSKNSMSLKTFSPYIEIMHCQEILIWQKWKRWQYILYPFQNLTLREMAHCFFFGQHGTLFLWYEVMFICWPILFQMLMKTTHPNKTPHMDPKK